MHFIFASILQINFNKTEHWLYTRFNYAMNQIPNQKMAWCWNEAKNIFNLLMENEFKTNMYLVKYSDWIECAIFF